MFCRFTILLCATLLLVCPLHARGQLDESALTPAEGILVLRNGNVLRGAITPVGDRYLVSVAEQGDVFVPAQEVELQCRDLAEAYQRKLRSIHPGRLTDRLDLAEWCLRNQLHSFAAEELLAALRIDPNHPRCRRLEQRMLLAAELAAKSPAKPTVGAEPLEKPEQQEDELRGLPSRAVEQFTLAVQPLLLNRCATGGCHGPSADNEMRLMHPPRGLPPAQRLTQKNLLAVLKTVDRSSPADSRLLAMARAAHGGLKTPALDQHDERLYQSLASWVVQALVEPAPADAESLDPLPDGLSTSGDASTHSAPPAFFPSGAAQQNDEIAGDLPHPSLVESASASALKPPRPGPAPRQPAVRQPAIGGGPKDPFDPEIFNRRFFGPRR